MCATAGASINETELCSSAAVLPHKVNLPNCVVGRQQLCHKVNLPRCETRRRLCHKVLSTAMWSSAAPPGIMTCDIFGTGQTNILALCYLFGKTYINQPTVAPHSSHWNQHSAEHYTRPNYWKSYWRDHTHSTEGFDDLIPLKRVRVVV